MRNKCLHPFACLSAGLTAMLLSVAPSAAFAQYVPRTVYIGHPHHHWGYYGSAIDAIGARIHASADLVRASGDASVNYARAREIRARAVRAEIANSVEYVRAHWEKKTIYEAEKMKRYVSPLERKRIRDSKTWSRLRDHPELNTAAIIKGTALNFLLDRLAGSVLAYDLSLGNSQPTEELAENEHLSLSPVVLNALQLQQDLPNGQQLVFRANDGRALNVDWWPYALRDEDISDLRDKIQQLRKKAVVESQGGTISNLVLKDLMQALEDLDDAFRKKYNRVRRQNSMAAFAHYIRGRRFIQSLAGEIARLQAVGKASAFDGSLKFRGDNLIQLLSFMVRNGLEFAPAQPGDEGAYYTVFQLMRDLYVTATD